MSNEQGKGIGPEIEKMIQDEAEVFCSALMPRYTRTGKLYDELDLDHAETLCEKAFAAGATKWASEAIDFAEWCADNYERTSHNGLWNSKYTTSDLLTMYINQTKNK